MELSATIRKFRWQDLEQFTYIFNEVNGITDTVKTWDAELMRQYLAQPSCKPEEHCYLAETDDSLVGFALIAPELPIGRTVASGGILRSHRNQGIGQRLARKAIEHAESLGASVLHVQASSDSAIAQRILDAEGFHIVKRYWQMTWESGEFPPLKLPHGFSLSAFRLGRDEQALTELQNASFGQHWGFCPNTVEEISAKVRLKQSDPEGIIFVKDGDRPAGYNWTMRAHNDSSSIGWIAMTGVHPDYRGKGLGTAVVVTGMEYLKTRGVGGIELEVDSENVPARELYLKLGFHRVHETVWFEKNLG